jgi:hypothetical protein
VRQVAQGGQRHVQHAGGAHAGVGDDQRALHAHALAFIRAAAAHGAVVDLDLGQVQDAGHASPAGYPCKYAAPV